MVVLYHGWEVRCIFRGLDGVHEEELCLTFSSFIRSTNLLDAAVFDCSRMYSIFPLFLLPCCHRNKVVGVCDVGAKVVGNAVVAPSFREAGGLHSEET